MLFMRSRVVESLLTLASLALTALDLRSATGEDWDQTCYDPMECERCELLAREWGHDCYAERGRRFSMSTVAEQSMETVGISPTSTGLLVDRHT